MAPRYFAGDSREGGDWGGAQEVLDLCRMVTAQAVRQDQSGAEREDTRGAGCLDDDDIRM